MAPHSEYYTAIVQPFPDGEGTIKDLVQERIRASSPRLGAFLWNAWVW